MVQFFLNQTTELTLCTIWGVLWVNNVSETNYKHYLGGPLLVHFVRKLATEPTTSTVLSQIWHLYLN